MASLTISQIQDIKEHMTNDESVLSKKYKAKKDYRRKNGHRQPYTMVKIESLTGEVKAAPVVEEEAPAEETTA